MTKRHSLNLYILAHDNYYYYYSVFHKTVGNPEALNCQHAASDGLFPIFREEVEAAVRVLKSRQTSLFSYLQAELVQDGGYCVIHVLYGQQHRYHLDQKGRKIPKVSELQNNQPHQRST